MSDAQSDKAGFIIAGREYPFPETFRLGDPVLITQTTGMTFKEFSAALDDEELREDPAVLLGLVAVAVSQGNPRWKRDRVIEFVEQIDLDSFDSFGGDDPQGPAEEQGSSSDRTAPEGQAGDSDVSPIVSSGSPDGGSE